MRIALSYKILALATGIVFTISLPLAAQTASQQQLPNQGQQPSSQSNYPSATDALSGGATTSKSGAGGDSMREAQNRQMDLRFLGQVAQASMLNVAMGKLAAEKSSSEAVKQFGQKMVTDHERALAIVNRVAAKDGVTVPDKLDSKHQERLDKLAKLSGAEFDRAYVRDQLKAHQRMVSYFQGEADNETDTAAKTMANNMLPAVVKHFDAVKDLNKTLTTVASR